MGAELGLYVEASTSRGRQPGGRPDTINLHNRSPEVDYQHLRGAWIWTVHRQWALNPLSLELEYHRLP